MKLTISRIGARGLSQVVTAVLGHRARRFAHWVRELFDADFDALVDRWTRSKCEHPSGQNALRRLARKLGEPTVTTPMSGDVVGAG